MLRELLNASPDIWLSDVESHFIPKYTRLVDRYGDLADRGNFDHLTDALRGTRAFWQWERRGVHIDTQTWYAACRRHDWPGVIEALFYCVFRQEIADPPTPWRALIWGDKTPVYMSEVPLLAGLFPYSRFIHILRDPRDCCLSSETAWGDSPLRTAQQWADRVRTCRTAGLALGPGRYLELRYEDLVEDVRGHLTEIFDFLGLPTPANAGEFLRVPENLGAARGARTVIASNKQKWKTKMDPAVRRGIEQITGDLLVDYGYEREHPGLPTRSLSSMERLRYRLRDAWQQLRFRRRELGSWRQAIRFLMAR